MEQLILFFVIILTIPGIILGILLLYFYFKNRGQHQSAIRRTHPIMGGLRYILEMVGPEFRQYWFSGDREEKPIDRATQDTIAKAGKYASTVLGFGSTKDFTKPDIYLANSMFPKNIDELRVDNEKLISTFLYRIVEETITKRKEQRYPYTIKPWHLHDQDMIVIGEKLPHPFHIKGLIGISAMSYGALSKSAVMALAQGVALSGGSFMNTGEGGLSRYHLSKLFEVGHAECPEPLYQHIYDFVESHQIASNFEIYDFVLKHPPHASGLETIHKHEKEVIEVTDKQLKEMVQKGCLSVKETPLIFQIGSGLFGARKDGRYDEETFLSNALRPEVKAIEIKMAQGAKVRGGKLPKNKITPEIAEIRGVPMDRDVDSPNRNPFFQNVDELFALIKNWRTLTGKPIGLKVVAGSEDSFEELAEKMRDTGEGPDYIVIDGGEGGTGATYQEMADSLGLPIYSGIIILQDTLIKYGVRDRVKIIASGMLATANKMAIALALGADLINVARAAMNTVGCINSRKCETNHCPVGVTSHLPELEKALVVEEKRYRTANYLTTMRQGLFMLGASCGIESPVLFNRTHITYWREDSSTLRMDRYTLHEKG